MGRKPGVERRWREMGIAGEEKGRRCGDEWGEFFGGRCFSSCNNTLVNSRGDPG